eukprot:1709477-Rhodomonas_salina.4
MVLQVKLAGEPAGRQIWVKDPVAGPRASYALSGTGIRSAWYHEAGSVLCGLRHAEAGSLLCSAAVLSCAMLLPGAESVPFDASRSAALSPYARPTRCPVLQ